MNVTSIMESLKNDTYEENNYDTAMNCSKYELKKNLINNIISIINNEHKSEVWMLISYILDHSRFYTNMDDINNLKAKALQSPNLTDKMKNKINNSLHTGLVSTKQKEFNFINDHYTI